MNINFFDDSFQVPKSREDVRIKQIGLFVHEDQRRVVFGIELTPFLEPPCIEVTITNGAGEPAGSLSVIDTITPNFSLTMHLRDAEVREPYELTAVVYYASPESGRTDIHAKTVTFTVSEPGERIFDWNRET